jgi:hypothetical protein
MQILENKATWYLQDALSYSTCRINFKLRNWFAKFVVSVPTLWEYIIFVVYARENQPTNKALRTKELCENQALSETQCGNAIEVNDSYQRLINCTTRK